MDAGLKKVLIGMAAGALGLATVGCGGDGAEAEEATVVEQGDPGAGGEASCGAGSCGGEAGGMDDMGGMDDTGGEEGGEAACGAGSCGGEE